MCEKIIIAVDGTESAHHAANQALMLAKSEQCHEVLIASVIPSYDGSLRMMGNKGVLEAMRKPYEDAVETATALAAGMGVKTRSVVAEGDPVEELLRLAEENGADMIALGKSGGYYSDLIPIGSVAAKVARLSDVDVLLVPNAGSLRLDTILTTLDGSSPALHAAESALHIAARYGAALSVLTVYELPLEGFALDAGLDKALHDKAAKRLDPVLARAEELGVRKVEGLVRQGASVHKAIIDEARRLEAGLIVMSTAGRGEVSRLLLGSVAERVICSGVAPVLLVKKGLMQ